LEGPYASLQGGGSHEIVIESPRHAISLSELTDDELRLSFRAYQSRVRAAMQNDAIRQITLFKNCRPEAGASIEHVHSQIIASPVVALSATSRFERCIRAYCDSGSSLLAALVRWEEQQGERVLESRGELIAFCPFASRFAFQIWIAGREKVTPFQDLTANELDRLADLVRWCVTQLETTLHHPPYNLILHLPPKLKSDYPLAEIFPWFIEIIPRLGRLAGFELAGGGWVLDWLPETAADRIRSARPGAE
jgi:UDPglucose--hexose-1-phosphate uridylyltransferase